MTNDDRYDPEELQELKRKIIEGRVKFIKQYAEWVKKTPNKVWSKQQKSLMR